MPHRRTTTPSSRDTVGSARSVSDSVLRSIGSCDSLIGSCDSSIGSCERSSDDARAHRSGAAQRSAESMEAGPSDHGPGVAAHTARR
eukprot:4089814-Prymnesium_polylepis.1